MLQTHTDGATVRVVWGTAPVMAVMGAMALIAIGAAAAALWIAAVQVLVGGPVAWSQLMDLGPADLWFLVMGLPPAVGLMIWLGVMTGADALTSCRSTLRINRRTGSAYLTRSGLLSRRTGPVALTGLTLRVRQTDGETGHQVHLTLNRTGLAEPLAWHGFQDAAAARNFARGLAPLPLTD
jgi:hypothetical protein